MMRLFRHVIAPFCAAIFAATFATGLAGCTEEQTTIDLSVVSLPEGGSMYTVAVLEGEDRLDVVAPSRMGLFVHRNDSGPWHRVDPRWPDTLPERQSAPLRTMGAAGNTLNFPHSQAFTAHQGRLWMVTGIPGPDGTHLLVSDNVGRTWTLVELPEAVEQAEKAAKEADQKESSGASALIAAAGGLAGADRDESPAAHVRLINHGDRGLFLASSDQLWRLRAGPDEDLAKDPWQTVSLEGVEHRADQKQLALPTMIRHYLPGTETRPFEMLTVLDDQLTVYRRSSQAQSWQPVATLGVADRELVEIPGSDSVLMLTSSGLLKSSNAAELWQPVPPPPLPQPRAGTISLEVLPPTDESAAAILLALKDGSIYRSVSLGQSWTEVRPSDADHRAISDFTHSQKRNRVWAATRGGGVLRSLDRGETWHQINDDLRATRTFDMDVDDNGGFLLGTDAGLFRLTGSPEDGHWQMLQDRSTTAIHVEMDSGVLISGTANGAVVRLEPNGKTTTAEAAPFDQLENIVYRPMSFRGTDVPPRAIVELKTRPDSQHVFAWSAQEGPLMSLDGGVSWTRMQLNPAFQSTLDGWYLSNFTTDFDERMYLVTHPLSTNAPTSFGARSITATPGTPCRAFYAASAEMASLSAAAHNTPPKSYSWPTATASPNPSMVETPGGTCRGPGKMGVS
jgi:photosystem II stability/assembly factor-like uncharacterized protein